MVSKCTTVIYLLPAVEYSSLQNARHQRMVSGDMSSVRSAGHNEETPRLTEHQRPRSKLRAIRISRNVSLFFIFSLLIGITDISGR